MLQYYDCRILCGVADQAATDVLCDLSYTHLPQGWMHYIYMPVHAYCRCFLNLCVTSLEAGSLRQ